MKATDTITASIIFNSKVKVDCNTSSNLNKRTIAHPLSYGTAAYHMNLVSDSDGVYVSHCATAAGERFIVSDDCNTQHSTITVAVGDIATVKALFEAEMNHFDTEVKWLHHSV